MIDPAVQAVTPEEAVRGIVREAVRLAARSVLDDGRLLPGGEDVVTEMSARVLALFAEIEMSRVSS